MTPFLCFRGNSLVVDPFIHLFSSFKKINRHFVLIAPVFLLDVLVLDAICIKMKLLQIVAGVLRERIVPYVVCDAYF